VAYLWRSPAAVDVSNDVALPLLTALVYSRVWGDSNENVEWRAVWDRFLERAWAVIVIDLIGTWLVTNAFVSASSGLALETVISILAFTAALFIVFADAAATIDDDVTAWNVVPRSLLRSAAVTFNPMTYARALVLFSIGILLQFASFALSPVLVRYHVAHALFWSQIPLLTVVQPPLAALIVLVYQDAKASG
jgi:hypothetical protein